MKASGMPIKDIKRYMDIFLKRQEVVKQQIEELNKIMSVIEHKISYYEKAIEAGTEDVVKKNKVGCRK